MPLSGEGGAGRHGCVIWCRSSRATGCGSRGLDGRARRYVMVWGRAARRDGRVPPGDRSSWCGSTRTRGTRAPPAKLAIGLTAIIFVGPILYYSLFGAGVDRRAAPDAHVARTSPGLGLNLGLYRRRDPDGLRRDPDHVCRPHCRRADPNATRGPVDGKSNQPRRCHRHRRRNCRRVGGGRALRQRAASSCSSARCQPGYHTTGRSAALFSKVYGPAQIRALRGHPPPFSTRRHKALRPIRC